MGISIDHDVFALKEDGMILLRQLHYSPVLANASHVPVALDARIHHFARLLAGGLRPFLHVHLRLDAPRDAYAFVKLHETGEVRDGHIAEAEVAVGVKIDRHVDKHVASGNNALKNVDQKLLSKTSRQPRAPRPPVRNILQHDRSTRVLACFHFFNINSIFLRSPLRSVALHRGGLLPSQALVAPYPSSVLRLALLFHAEQSGGGERGVAESRSTREAGARQLRRNIGRNSIRT